MFLVEIFLLTFQLMLVKKFY